MALFIWLPLLSSLSSVRGREGEREGGGEGRMAKKDGWNLKRASPYFYGTFIDLLWSLCWGLSCLISCPPSWLSLPSLPPSLQAWRGMRNDFLMLYTDPAFESPIEALFAYPGEEEGGKGGKEGRMEGGWVGKGMTGSKRIPSVTLYHLVLQLCSSSLPPSPFPC